MKNFVPKEGKSLFAEAAANCSPQTFASELHEQLHLHTAWLLQKWSIASSKWLHDVFQHRLG